MSAPARPRTATPAKRAPKKPAAAPPAAAPSPVGDAAPVRIGERPSEQVQMVTIFSIDDVDYQIPAFLPPQPGLRFLREARDPKIGTTLALSNLVVDVLGDDNLRALEGSPKLTREDVRDVFRAVQRHVLGNMGVQEPADPS